MMSRRELFDRLAVAAVGAALTAAGVQTVLSSRRPGATKVVDLSPITEVWQQDWWRWAGGAAGVVLIVVGLRWLAAHRWPAKAGRMGLGENILVTLSADVPPIADAAATSLADAPGVLKAAARTTVERGRPTVTLTATVAARHGLAPGAAAGDAVARTVARMTGDKVAVRTLVRADATHRKVLV